MSVPCQVAGDMHSKQLEGCDVAKRGVFYDTFFKEGAPSKCLFLPSHTVIITIEN